MADQGRSYAWQKEETTSYFRVGGGPTTYFPEKKIHFHMILIILIITLQKTDQPGYGPGDTWDI